MNADVSLVEVLGWPLLNFLWQGALIGCGASLLCAIMRNARPQSRYLILCSALLASVWRLSGIARATRSAIRNCPGLHATVGRSVRHCFCPWTSISCWDASLFADHCIYLARRRLFDDCQNTCWDVMGAAVGRHVECR